MLERHPIVFPRKPIISRTAIYHRVACCSQLVKCETCKLCSEYQDCQGNIYCSEQSEESDKIYRVIHVDESYSDWDELEAKIWDLDRQKVFLRLIIDREIPDRILWATSYSAKNVLQLNVNMIYLDDSLPWVQKLMFMSGNCGLYCVLFLYPIVPDLLKTYHVIDVIDNFRNTGYHHTTLKFSEFTECKEVDGYLNFNGKPVSTKFLTKTDAGGWKCTDDYLKKFLDKVNLYAIPRKMSVSICGISKDCTGLGG